MLCNFPNPNTITWDFSKSLETGSLTTGTILVKKIPGASNVQFNNDNGVGLHRPF